MYRLKFIIILAVLTIPFFTHAQEIRDITFPVDGEYTLTDSYGDPRSGGRTHQGVDIMAEKMTPLVSAVDGYVEYLTEQETSWGYAIYIKDTDNYSYRYLHINNDHPDTDDGQGGISYAFPPTITRGTRVVAGQLVAWAGDSGNAENAGSHLHFEIWTPQGYTIDPYPSLVATTGLDSTFQFNRNLQLGDTGADVKEIQKYLNRSGFTVSPSGPGSPDNETDFFGPATMAALTKFQQASGISPASGFLGPVTRSFINQTNTKPQNTNSNIQPGWLVKNTKYNEVFYVNPNMQLCWIVNEQVAQKNFGLTWNLTIKEFDDLNQFGLKYGENLK